MAHKNLSKNNNIFHLSRYLSDYTIQFINSIQKSMDK